MLPYVDPVKALLQICCLFLVPKGPHNWENLQLIRHSPGAEPILWQARCFFSDGFGEWKGKSGRPPQPIQRDCRRVSGWFSYESPRLTIHRQQVCSFLFKYISLWQQTICHSYSVLQLPSETSAFFSWVAKAMWRSEACFSYIESDGVWMPVARHSLVIMSPSTYNFALESVFLSLCEIRGSSMLIYVWIKECSPVKKKLYNENNENCTVSSYPYQQAVISVFSWKYLLGQYLYDCPITISLLGSMVPIKLYRPKKRGS